MFFFFFFSSRRRHTILTCDWSSDVCSSDLPEVGFVERPDSNETYGDLTFKVRPSIPSVRELQFEGFLLHAPDTLGQVSTQEWQNTFRAEFHNGAYTDEDIVDVLTQRITTPFHIYKSVFIPNGLYHFTRHQLTYG